jgi:uncharacterized protein (DUF1697 family)
MTTYCAFLRAINVGGRMVKMERLRKILSSLDVENVRTLIQSGNVQFESNEKEGMLTRAIEAKLKKELRFEVAVFLRSIDEMKAIVSSPAYKSLAKHEKGYIVFLKKPLPVSNLPLFSPNKDVEVIALSGREAYCVPHEVGGKWGFPNAFIEKTFKVEATTRNPETTLKMSSLI